MESTTLRIGSNSSPSAEERPCRDTIGARQHLHQRFVELLKLARCPQNHPRIHPDLEVFSLDVQTTRKNPAWKRDYSGSVRRFARDGVDLPLARLFVHPARAVCHPGDRANVSYR